MRVMPFLLALLAAFPARAEQPLRVTTDSSSYCDELATRLQAQPGSRQEPTRSLAEEGRRLCETGHVRTGIAKLRRALRAAQSIGG
ncbi:hypothetical protein [Falsiroseomonas sp. CW058]|uniref:hypothetical protein n=1 Tax=Falsiroseomonas sp. CW058 TaxID=3388664 RepID=UPI003D31FA47